MTYRAMQGSFPDAGASGQKKDAICKVQNGIPLPAPGHGPGPFHRIHRLLFALRKLIDQIVNERKADGLDAAGQEGQQIQ